MKKTAILALLALAANGAALADTYTFIVTGTVSKGNDPSDSARTTADQTLDTRVSAYVRTTNGISRYPGGMITIFK